MIRAMPRALARAEWIAGVVLLAWVASAVALVDIEYYDGFDSILNARYFTGQWDRYTPTRGPLVGALLVPAEWIRTGFGGHPLEVRPHHAVMALLHGLYLGVTYLLLRGSFGRSWAVLTAFLAAVPTFVFFSYAPFVSHDIVPGLALVAMLVLSQRFHDRQDSTSWFGLAALGAAAALVKPVFGLFWIVVLGGEIVASRRSARRLTLLFAAACASALAYALVTGATTASVYPDTAFAERVVRHLRFLTVETHQRNVVEPVWVYLRNAPAYGPLAVLLVLPALAYAWRAGPLLRRFAVAWIVLVVAMHLVGVRQVRYLAFLGPVTAFLVVEPVGRLLRQGPGRIAVASLLVLSWVPVHPYAVVSEMARIATPFYRHSALRELMRHVADGGGAVRGPIYVNWAVLSFVPERDTPFAGDLYHDVFHFGPHQLEGLYGLPSGAVIDIDPARGRVPDRWPVDATAIVCTNANIVNRTSWMRGPAENREDLEQIVLRPRTAALVRAGDGSYRLDPGGPVTLRSGAVGGRSGSVVSGEAVAAIGAQTPFARADLPGVARPAAILFSEAGEAFVPGLSPEARFDRVAIRYFARVYAYSNARRARPS